MITNPEYDRYLGQFPIDYVPEQFQKLSAEKVEKMPIALSNNGAIEFSLMLNGAKAKVTDIGTAGLRGLDDSNQVKVLVRACSLETQTQLQGHKPYNTRQFFELELKKELDGATKVSKDGVDCYQFKDRRGGMRCFGVSGNSSVSGFHLYVPSDVQSSISGKNSELSYGCLNVQWYSNQKNLHEAYKIDTAIWRLLDAWNVSPISNQR